MRSVLIIATFLVAACVENAEPILSMTGYGPIEFGVRLEDAERVAGGRLEPERALEPACDYVRFATLPRARFMVENGVVTRAEVEAGVPNSLKIEPGTSLDSIRKARPEARIEPAKYDPEGYNITFSSPDARAAIVMEVSGGVVKDIRAGLQPSVGYVEHCL
jgi:hypothetical protein